MGNEAAVPQRSTGGRTAPPTGIMFEHTVPLNVELRNLSH